jgi:beta-lactamase regulating signal transducer with metallopeptidase domain
MSSATIASWLLTYLLHSTVLLGGTLLLASVLGNRRLALQQTLLRTALLGGLLTSGFQTGLGVAPAAGTIPVDLAVVGNVAATVPAVPPGDLAAGSLVETAVTPSTGLPAWALVLLAFWATGAVITGTALGRSVLQLEGLLATRSLRRPGRLLERLASRFGLKRPVRYSTSPAIAVPFATGIRRPEICCPERFEELALEYQAGVFAHELAHLARRDPAWQLAYRLGEVCLCLQPLNRVARRRLESIAEHLADERAAACTGDRLGLARCLVAMAHWPSLRSPGVPAVALAAGARLDSRVRRLLGAPIDAERSPRWAPALLVAALGAAACVLPVVAPSSAHAELSRSGSAAAPVDQWSAAGSTDTDRSERSPADPAPAPEAAPAPWTAPEAPVAPEPEVAPAADGAPAPAAAPEAPAAPEPTVAPAAPPAPGAAPKPPRSAHPAAASAPVDGPALRSPADPAAPAPPDDPSAPDDIEHTPDAARAGTPEKPKFRPHEIEELRARAEAREAADRAREAARAAAEEARHVAERDRAAAREAAHEAQRLSEEQRQELRDRAEALARERRELDREGADRAREAARAAAEEARHVAERDRAAAREAAHSAQRLSEEQRREMRDRAEALARERRTIDREQGDRAREAARAAAEESRHLAELAEAERRAKEEPER